MAPVSRHRIAGTQAFLSALALPMTWAPAAIVQAAPPSSHAAPQEQFTCQRPGTTDHREIGIFRAAGSQRCRVDYTRDGRTQSLWSAGHDYRFCVRKAVEIVGLLENVHFKCTPHTAGTQSSGR
ncbi:MAG TPA: hypothetical protein VMF03_20790 [Steroidobacteraceae bacterium]|nr:hypothetical protein [Steroidobacteraceae bacterium]